MAFKSKANARVRKYDVDAICGGRKIAGRVRRRMPATRDDWVAVKSP
jgi:hypothetical protein